MNLYLTQNIRKEICLKLLILECGIMRVDCTRLCPNGGSLSSNCEICECSSSTIIGMVTDQTNFTLEGIGVYLSYRPWEPIATTNVRGRYTVSNICFNSTSVFVKSIGFSTLSVTPRQLNSTHWEANFQMKRLGLYSFV